MKPKIFISFDYENDKNYKYLLTALAKNDSFDISFYDYSTNEIDSWNIPTIKAALTKKIKKASHTLVIIGKYANSKHKDSAKIGYKNWINFEIAKSKEENKKLVAVKIKKEYESPDEILGAGASWAMSYTVDAIEKAIDGA